MSRKFVVSWQTEVLIELDDEVIDRVDDEWRASLYNLHGANEIAEHIAANIVLNKWGLSDLDGWADMKDSAAKIVDEDTFFWECEEVKE